MKKNYRKRDLGPEVLSNNKITADTVRVTMLDGESKIMSKTDAIVAAKTHNLDLVLINAIAEPPVCKIVELSKHMYELKQRAKELQKKQRESIVENKEVRLGLNIDKHDIETKAKQAQKFIEKGAKLTVTVILRGRERGKQTLARDLLNTFAELIGVEYENISVQNNKVIGKI